MKVGRLLAMAIVGLAVMSCGGPGTGATPATSPNPSDIPVIDSRAADLRVRLDVLLGEHVMVIAKQADAAAAGRTDEYAGYATLLTTNRDELTAVMASAFGASAGTAFESIWSDENDNLVDYTIGVVSHNSGKSKAAWSALLGTFVPKFADFISKRTQVSASGISDIAQKLAMKLKAFIDELVAKSYAPAFTDLRAAHAASGDLGDTLAALIARQYADKFPGVLNSAAVGLRVSLNSILQEDSYLASMATGALAGARNSEQVAALAALSANADELAGLLGDVYGADAKSGLLQVWSDRNAELVIYSGTTNETRRQDARSALTGAYVQQLSARLHDTTGLDLAIASPAIQVQIQALVDVVDDQRISASAKQIADDDRTAAATMLPLADLIATAVVASRPEKFA